MSPLRHALLVLAVVSACQPLPEQPAGPSSQGSETLALEPEAPLDAAPTVLRVHVAVSAPDAEAPSDVLLIADELSDYHLARILKRDLPQTLVERVVPTLAWSEPGAIVLAPSVPLSSDATYSIASPELGRIGTIQTASEHAPLLSRLWPPSDGGAGSERVLYCADHALSLAPAALELSPGAVPASAERDPESCLSLAVATRPSEGTRLVPPPRVGDLALDPAPLEHRVHASPPDAACSGSEIAFGPGCARVEDDRLILRSRPEPTLWSIHGATFSVLEVAGADAELVVRGLTPSTWQTLEVVALDLSGRERRTSVSVQTGAPRARLVINEVLANPLGPEPQQEWVELVNDGAIAVNLEGFVLEDLGGATALPPGSLAPGEHVVVAREDFLQDDGLDVPVPPGARLLRVQALGKSGLSNGGEPLVLRAADGTEVSRFPALPKPKAGFSSARRRSFDLDHDPDAFSYHGEPGASPGAANVVP